MPFTFQTTPINNLTVIKPKIFTDTRGFFKESYKYSEFAANGITDSFIQDNHSLSTQNVLRGLHFQKGPFAQAKLVQVIQGAVWDVAVDLRPSSPTFLQWHGLELTEENQLSFYIPAGFAHGFVTLSSTAHLTYKCSTEYNAKADAGIHWNDPSIAIQWPVSSPLLSEKDTALPAYSSKVLQ